MKQNFKIDVEIDVPENHIARFNKNTLQIEIYKDDKKFKELAKKVFDDFEVIGRIPLSRGDMSYDNDPYATNYWTEDDCDYKVCDFLEILKTKWEDKIVEEWAEEFADSMPEYATLDETEMYHTIYRDHCCWLYLDRSFEIDREDD